MEASVTDRLWSLEDMVGIVDEWETNQRTEPAAELEAVTVFQASSQERARIFMGSDL